MKIFSKFKQFSREIKLIIITALIVSCVGVYAAGECIISATADDVTYSNTTVQAAIDELYSMSESYCPPGYECTRTLNTIMENKSEFDNEPSAYVTGTNGINFNAISSDTNGKGVYEISNTHNNPHPIYYYRGDVNNNNVKFGGFCWKLVRTTDTGGVKMIYSGEPDQDGYCNNTTGASTRIGTSAFNSSQNSLSDVGYMYGTRYPSSFKSSSNLSTSYKYGEDVTYSGGTYTLTNTMTTTGTWSTDYNTLSNNHYTCFTTGTTCSSVYYIFQTDSTRAYYITLTNGKKVEDAINDMFVNTTNSAAKTTIDNWYNSNLTSYTSYIEDTIYCNDRSISSLGGWNPNGGNTTSNYQLYFGSYTRSRTNHTPSLACSRTLDRFTVSSSIGNGALTYPVGLLTSDEIMYAGGKYSSTNNSYYLYTNNANWTISSSYYGEDLGGPASIAQEIFFDFVTHPTSSNGFGSEGVSSDFSIRPVISLKPDLLVESGNGTPTNPYVVKTN